VRTDIVVIFASNNHSLASINRCSNLLVELGLHCRIYHLLLFIVFLFFLLCRHHHLLEHSSSRTRHFAA
jgi:hypothetical protein